MVVANAAGHPLDMNTHITDTPEIRRLQRSRSDRKLAGVCGGLARYFEIHPAVFRVGFVVLALLGGSGILIYAAAALVMPDEGKQDSIATAALRDKRDRPWPLIGLGLLAVAGAALLSRATLWPHGDAWFLFLIAGALILWITRQPPADPAMDATELAAQDSRRVRRAVRRVVITLVALIAVVVAAAAVFAAVFNVHVGRGIGDRNYAVTNVQNLQSDYRLGIGTLDLDLSALQLPVGETHLDASVDVGDLHVIVPAGTSRSSYHCKRPNAFDLDAGSASTTSGVGSRNGHGSDRDRRWRPRRRQPDRRLPRSGSHLGPSRPLERTAEGGAVGVLGG
jgi:phage shock protein PspC (stress-responsive transcriptional regulator)